jgi:hypothetical protein
MQLVALFAAFFVITASLFDWDWFFNNSKAMFFVNLLGRNGARAFYLLLGVLLLFLSYYLHAYVQTPAAAGT